MIVCKFGGTSVGDAEALRRLVAIVKGRLQESPLVVVSALSGVSDELIRLVGDAAAGEDRLRGIAERHRALLAQCGDRLAATELAHALDADLASLESHRKGIALLEDASPQVRARVVGTGERMSSRIVAAWLRAAGMNCVEIDAADVVRTIGRDIERDPPDPEAIRERAAAVVVPHLAQGRVVLTQGFIGRDPAGRPSLLGRGGSDYSASLLGRTLGASRIEIWTDVDGVLTANPKIVREARRVRVLSFDEASELAYFGAKVLHPSTLLPAVEADIPVHVLNARRPEGEGTTIVREAIRPKDARFVVKAIAEKRGITVVHVTSTRMLMAHGFLARVFEVFDRFRTAVDLVATSEVSVSVTVDDASAVFEVAEALRSFARVEIERGMAVVCLVGEGMRGRASVAAEVFRAVRDFPVAMITKGASAINISLVVAESDVASVVAALHETFFQGTVPAEIFGESVQGPPASEPAPAWLREVAESHGTPCYVYDLAEIGRRAEAVRGAVATLGGRAFYAMKANANAEILARIVACGLGIEATSPGEVERAIACGCDPANLLFSAANARTDEIVSVLDRGGRVTLSALSEIARVGRERKGAEVLLRINPALGAGHHRHVVTGGAHSKFGIALRDLPEALALAEKEGVRVVGLHAHIGSGIDDPAPLLANARLLFDLAAAHPGIRILDLGGGFGIPYRDGERALDLAAVVEGIRPLLTERSPEIWIEPGRFIVGAAGWLLARVTCRKESDGLTFVGLDTGMNHLLRPALYGAYHRIDNLSGEGRPMEWVEIVGNVCESSDVFASGRAIARCEEGDLLAIRDAGAYGYVMASRYNLRDLPKEVVQDGAPTATAARTSRGSSPGSR
ncbi:MAG TPA: lysine-sensitive aspartokinase 3 [Candidatus Polarisedimenticolaceae bacterium]|nr:lysine-sensitive aspartokinase 3 [Candidatus Polarisedimenticolaceae bacterium]